VEGAHRQHLTGLDQFAVLGGDANITQLQRRRR
jgi:hypothetical protein